MQLPAFLENLDPSIYLGDNYVVLDFEVDTSHGDYGAPVHPDNQLLLACWKTGPGHPTPDRSVCQWGNEYDMGELLEAIAQADFIVAHNSKYELGWLRRAGIDLRKVFAFDTKIAEYVLLGNKAAGDDGMRPMSTSLDMACRRRGLPIKDPVVDTLIGNQINPVRIPQPWLQARCKQDVETTEQVFLHQRKLLHDTNRLAVQYTRCLLTPVLVDIESEGQALDPERVTAAYEEARAKRVELEAKMRELTGGINWRSGKQVGEFIYDTLKFEELRDNRGQPKRNAPNKLHPNGSRKTDQKTLALLKANTKEQKAFLALRKELGRVNALLTKNLEFFMGIVAEYGGVFYSELNQTSTTTHRLSSTGIPQPIAMFPDKKGRPTIKTAQAQNTPRKLKKLFRAKRAGWLMADPDGSQLEFRVAVELGNDEQGKIDIEDPNWDAHVTSAAAMEQIPYAALYERYKAGEEKATDMRQDAKPETFKPLYGGRKGSKKQERWYEEFRKRYKGIADWQERNIEEVVRTKRLITPWGLRFYWPYAARKSGYVNVTTAVCNYPVQTLATAEIIPVALVYLWHRIGAEGFDDRIRIVNTVHDSAPTELRPDAVDDFRRLVKQSFTRDVYRYLEVVYKMDFKVPLGVGLKVGEFLGDGKEESYNIWKNGKEIRVK